MGGDVGFLEDIVFSRFRLKTLTAEYGNIPFFQIRVKLM